MRKASTLALLTCVATMAAQAQESATESEDRNFIEVFVGITHDDGENEESLGLT